ncbi:MAG: ferredoxin--NADP reductase [Bdellovibrionales bacterium]|nr:ferredoxin--NADP reductase [Bdellovibrionales bacterium]
MNAIVSQQQHVADGLWIVRVKPDSGEVPEFVAGQYAELGFPQDALDGSQCPPDSEKRKIVRRAYSIASAPSDRAGLEFFIVRVDEGQLTPKLYGLDVGDRVWLGPKIKGKFTLEEIPRDKNLIMVSTGTGLAPYVSMLREYGANPPWKRFVVIHGVRNSHDLGYREELEQAAKSDPRVIYIPSVTREPEGSNWSGLRGRVNTLLEPEAFERIAGFELSPEDCHVFLCGNPDMITSVQESLEARGFSKHSKRSPGNIHFERYW